MLNVSLHENLNHFTPKRSTRWGYAVDIKDKGYLDFEIAVTYFRRKTVSFIVKRFKLMRNVSLHQNLNHFTLRRSILKTKDIWILKSLQLIYEEKHFLYCEEIE